MFIVRLLGAMEIEKDGISRPYGARKYATLLALFALNPRRSFSRSELVASLWPESDEEAGRGALRTALTMLRKELSADSLVTTGETVSLAPDAVTTDVAELERCATRLNQATTVEGAAESLRQLQQLYRGPLLPGRYDDWIVAERTRLEGLMRGAQARYEILQRTLDKEWPPDIKTPPILLRLPTFTTRFLGRDYETASLFALLKDPSIRLVTLTGTGGIGKTRLSVEVARRVAGPFVGAICFVPLAACTDGEEILAETARALSLEPSSAQNWEEAITRRLEGIPHPLIILDNAEHLVNHGGSLAIRRLLEIVPTITLLVTSRQVLGIEGERAFPLQGLKDSKDQLLFVEHAQGIQPEFAVTEANREAVQQLCTRLEGIPLAIELCAAWVSVLTPQQILVKMEDRFALLKSRRQDILPRHRSLHAALEWGTPTEPDLLSFFLALSVFRGGFTLEASETVAGNDALERLAMLREQSLLVAETQLDGTMRYRLLETVREFADEKLTPETRVTLQRKHLSYFHDVAARLTPLLTGVDAAVYFIALERENPNFRAAIEFGLKDTIDSVLQARSMTMLLRWFWEIRGHRMPVRVWQAAAFARRNELPPVDHAWIIMDYAPYQPLEEAESLCREALSLFEQHTVPLGLANVYESLGRLCNHRDDLAGMELYYHQAAATRESIGDVRGAGYVLAQLAGSYFQRGDQENARTLWRKCRAISESLNDIGSLAVLDRAEACSFLGEGRPAESLPLFERAATTFRLKGETWHLMDTLDRFGDALTQVGSESRAIETLREATVLAENWGDLDRADSIRKKIALLTDSR